MDPISLLLANRGVVRPPVRPAVRPPIRPPVRPPVQAPVAQGPPPPPNFAALLAQLAASNPARSEADWTTLLDARTKPFTDAINSSSNQARAFNEYNFETKAAATRGLGEGFLSILTGGKTGDEAMAYSKENFGGSYLGAQAMSLAANELTRLTNDFDDGDWKITGQYLEAMQEMPAIREELRANLEKQDLDAYTRKVTEATLLMDETWRYWSENRKNFEADRSFKREVGESARDFKERKRQYDEQMVLARGELGIKAVNAQSGAVRAETGVKNAATGAQNAEIRNRELKLKQAKAEYAKSKDKVSQGQAQERINIAKGNLEVSRLRAKKGPAASKFTAAQKQDMAETSAATASDDFFGGVDDKGNKFPPRRPVETLRDLIASGVPYSIAIRAIQRYGKDPNADAYWKATLGWTKSR